MSSFKPLQLTSERSPLQCLHLPVADARAAVLWVFGTGGGFHGPAGGLYDRLGESLAHDGIASLQVAYRRPGDLPACVADVLVGIAALSREAPSSLALVGHSFGGAVVIRAALVSSAVHAVAALSSQSYGTEGVEALAPKALFLLHGTADEVLPTHCSEDIYRRAGEPKLLLRPVCRHGLDECRETVDHELGTWLRTRLLG
jgi:dienelactone hydrolase